MLKNVFVLFLDKSLLGRVEKEIPRECFNKASAVLVPASNSDTKCDASLVTEISTHDLTSSK